MELIPIFPTIKCKYCKLPADRVCCSLSCNEYPFICPAESKCLNQWDLPEKLHKHQTSLDSQLIITMEQYRKTVDQISEQRQIRDDANTSTMMSIIRRRLYKIQEQYQKLLHDNSPVRVSNKASEIMAKIEIPNNFPDLKGDQISYLIKQNQLYKRNSEQLQPSFAYQKSLNQLLQAITTLLDGFNVALKVEYVGSQEPQPIPSAEIFMTNQCGGKQHLQKFKITEQQSVSEEIHRAEIMIRQAKSLFQQRKTLSAIALLKKAQKLDPSNWEIYLLLGQYTKKNIKNNKLILDYLEKAKKFNPYNSQIYNQLGLLHYDNKRYTSSISQLRKSIDLCPQLQNIYNLGNAYYSSASFSQALKCYYRVLQEFQDKDKDYYASIAACYRQLGSFNQALEYYELALEQEELDSCNWDQKWRRNILDTMKDINNLHC